MTPISAYSSNLIETAGVVPLVPPRMPTDAVSEVAQAVDPAVVSKAAELAALWEDWARRVGAEPQLVQPAASAPR